MKMSDIKIDVAKQEEGDWVDDIPELEGVRFKVRGAQNRDWRKLNIRLINTVPRNKRAGGSLDPDEQDRILAILLRDTCLLDWDGILGEDDKPLPYSKEQAWHYLSSPEYPQFREGVLWAANEVARQKREDFEDDAKN
jgi:hypothetical protein